MAKARIISMNFETKMLKIVVSDYASITPEKVAEYRTTFANDEEGLAIVDRLTPATGEVEVVYSVDGSIDREGCATRISQVVQGWEDRIAGIEQRLADRLASAVFDLPDMTALDGMELDVPPSPDPAPIEEIPA